VELDGRTVSGGYRYGYQGSEKDNEFKGNGNSYTTEFRQLDPRLGRWLSVDPMYAKFPWQSPYCAMDDNPIRINDLLGLEGNPSKKPYHESLNPAPKNVQVTEEYNSDKDYTYKLDNGELFTLDPIGGQARKIKVDGIEYKATYSTNPDKAGEFIGYYSNNGNKDKFAPRMQYGYAWNYLEGYRSAVKGVLEHWYENGSMYGYEDANGKQFNTYWKSNYNCFEMATSIVRDKEPNFVDGIMSPGVFNQDLRTNFENVKRDDMEPGFTIIRMAKDGDIKHACVYMGRDVHNEIIILTKNDGTAQPRIMLLKELMEQRPDYGSPQGAFGDKTPYYTLKWESR
jgi:RHS repeat-associated protein